MTPAKCLLIKCTDQTHAKHKNKYQMNNNTVIHAHNHHLIESTRTPRVAGDAH